MLGWSTMASILAYGMSVPPGPRHLDLTPLTAIVTAILVARFLVGLRLSPPTVVGAAFAGALWAYLTEPWGLVVPSTAALLLIMFLRRIRPSRGGRAGPG
jgi:hypothetical protein